MRIEIKLYRNDGTLLTQEVYPISGATAHKIGNSFPMTPIIDESGNHALLGWETTFKWVDLQRR